VPEGHFVGLFRNLATLLFVLTIPIALVSTTVRFVFNEPRVYRYAIDEYGAVQASGINRSELIRAGAELRTYLNSDSGPLRIQVMQDNRTISLFNPRETTHLNDVRRLVGDLNKVQLASTLYVLVYVASVVLWSREVSLRALAVAMSMGSVLTLGVLGAAAALSTSGFDAAWLQFHEVFFSDNYKFNPLTDHMMQIFPQDFWQSIVFFVGVMIAAEASLILIGACIYLGATGHRSGRPRARRCGQRWPSRSISENFFDKVHKTDSRRRNPHETRCYNRRRERPRLRPLHRPPR